MNIEEINPFVRQALITSINYNTKYDVFYELKSSDCRLFYIVSGKGRMTVLNKEYVLSPGCTVLFKAGTEYVWQPDDLCSIDFIVINFDYTKNFTSIRKPFHPEHADVFSETSIHENVYFENEAILNTPIVLNNLKSIESRLRLMTTEFNVLNDFYLDELLSSVLRSIIISIVREVKICDESDRNKYISITRDIIQFIQNNYNTEISYKLLSERFYMNPVYLNRIFKKNSGVSLHSFILNYRINMAMELLRSSNISVREVAYSVGFTDIPHFSKMFKKVTGVSPGKYRDSSDKVKSK